MSEAPEPGSSRMSAHEDLSLRVSMSTFIAGDKDEYDDLNLESIDSENFVPSGSSRSSWKTLTLGGNDENEHEDNDLAGDDQNMERQMSNDEMTSSTEGMNQQLKAGSGQRVMYGESCITDGGIEHATACGDMMTSSSVNHTHYDDDHHDENPGYLRLMNVKKRKIDRGEKGISLDYYYSGSKNTPTKTGPNVVKFVRRATSTESSDEAESCKCSSKPKKSPSKTKQLETTEPEPSVLQLAGDVGDKLRENFCRLMNKEGPLFITCRQCILQVKRARVFPDSRAEINNLLSHIQLHEDIEREDEDEHIAEKNVDNKNAKKPTGSKKSCGTALKKKKKSPVKKSGASSSQSVQRMKPPSGKGLNSSSIVALPTTADHDSSSIELEQLLVPDQSASGSTSQQTLVLGSGKETYTCALCNLTLTPFQEFINHSVSVHIKSNFSSVKINEKTGAKGLLVEMVDNDLSNDSVVHANAAGQASNNSGDEVELIEETHNKESLNELHLKIENMLEGTDAKVEDSAMENMEVCVVTQNPPVAPKRVRKKKPRRETVQDDAATGEEDYVRGPFICIECGDGEHDCYRLREHMSIMHGDRARVFVCKTCDTTWSEKNFNQFQKHMSLYHPNDEINCYFCRLTFKSCMDMRYHQAQHRPPLNFCCPYCYHEFSWILESEFSNHVTKHLDEDLPFQCRECQQHFGDFVARRQHQTAHAHDVDVLKFHDELRPFICTGCGKQFVNTGKTTGIRALRQHVCQSGVTLDPRFECQVCKCLFPLGRSLRQHMREKHEHHMCHICAVICKSKATLDEHVGYEHYGGTFPCPICEESFDTAQKMKQHKTREHGARNFICEFCGQGFAARLLLVRHLKKHDEFQGFVCHVCGDKFLLADRLETHFRKYHAHVVSDQEYETIILDNVQTAIATDTIAIIHESTPFHQHN